MTKTPRNPNGPTLATSNANPVTPIRAKKFKAKVAAMPEATFSPEALSNLLNKLNEQTAELAALKGVDIAKANVDKAVKTLTAKSDKAAQNERDTIKAFAKIGIKGVIPKVNVLTFNLWLAKGFRPLEGSSSVRISNLRLFHESQVRPLTAAETKAAKAQLAAAKLRREGSPMLEVQ